MSSAGQLLRSVSFALLALLLTGCADEREPLVIWSNTIDAAFFVERYNAVHDRDARFVFVDRLTEAITQQPPEADLIIGRWVRVPSVNELMMPLTELEDAADGRGRTPIRPRDSLPPALRYERWIPVAFTLPTVVFEPERATLPPGVTVSLERLGSHLSPVDAPQQRLFRFTPLADPRGLYALVRALGVTVSADAEGDPTWDSGALTAAVDRLRAWQLEWNAGAGEERLYTERYLYERWERHLATERLLAAYLPSDELFSWRFFEEPRYDFRVLAGDGDRVLANEDVVYAGVPRTAGERDEAFAFLTWLTTPEVQLELVEAKLEQRVDTFGLFGGFSTLPEANRAILRTLYPQLVGRIPSVENVVLPAVLPRYWDEARAAVVVPTLVEQLPLPDEIEDAESVLRDRLARWYLQRGD